MHWLPALDARKWAAVVVSSVDSNKPNGGLDIFRCGLVVAFC
jgi:hypothetical protein